MALKLLLLTSALVAFINAAAPDREFCQTLEWTGGNFEWPSDATKKIYQNSGKSLTKNVIVTRSQIYKDEAIVAMPRYKPGVAVTLGKISLKQKGCETTIQPFPCWSCQEEGNCQYLQSVVDIFLDAQEVLWVLDTGVVNSLNNPIRRCPPKVQAYSMQTGKLLKTLDLSGLVAQASRLQHITVEYSQDGRPFAYVSDAATRSILVFDVAGNKGYRVVLPKAVVSSNGKRDVLYISLVRKGCGNNYLIFTYLSSSHVFSIRTDYLRSGSTAGRIVDLGIKPQKMVVLGTDQGSAVFFRYEGGSEVYRWDANTAFNKENFALVYRSPECLFATQVMADTKRLRMRVLESNFHDYIQNTVGCGATQQINVIGGCT